MGVQLFCTMSRKVRCLKKHNPSGLKQEPLTSSLPQAGQLLIAGILLTVLINIDSV